MRVLLIGPYAPHGQVGAIRVLSLSKYLMNLGYEVSVLCLSEECIRSFDPKGLSSTIPEGINVITYDIDTKTKSHVKKNRINEKEFNEALSDLLRRETFDAAILSVGPFYTLRSVRILKAAGIPCIVDYRDLNISSPEKRKRNGIINKAKMLFYYPGMYSREKECLKNATYITVVAPDMQENMSSYFKIPKSKFAVAYNGYDDVALEGMKLLEPDPDHYTIGYFGKLMYYNRELTCSLFNAIEDFNRQGHKVRLLHIGPENPAIQAYFHEHNLNSGGWYSCAGQKNYKEGIKLLSSCNACTLEYVYAEGPGTKVFDYIYLNKPILAVIKPGIFLERFLQPFDHSFICYEKEDVLNALNELVQERDMKLTEWKPGLLEEFSRTRQNRVFKELLDKIEHGV
ncbi:MAG: glycosyltransferase [Lachnospiraceae bacterium]|nr:glycosyltransferase [Lachnospiraceae bacterium]